MEVYLVGGAVRDIKLGVEPKDKDYVVVGETEQSMIEAGFTKVGADFPVFLHPETGEEYALARTERKVGIGYHGFESYFGSDVTLEDDLARRDLTCNSMALDKDGHLIDPFDGAKDIENHLLRATSDAFKEDPVRVLRLGRFLARLGPNWQVCPETLVMCHDLVDELSDLNGERIWKELSRAMMEPHPRLFFEFLREACVLDAIFPDIYALTRAKENLKWHPEGDAFEHTMLVMDQAAKDDDLELRMAALLHDIGKGRTPEHLMKDGKHHGHEVTGAKMIKGFAERYRMPAKMASRIEHVTRFHMNMHKLDELNPKTFVKMFDSMRALNDPSCVILLFELGVCDARGRKGSEYDNVRPAKVKLLDKYVAYSKVKFVDVVKDPENTSGERIKQMMYQARVKACA